MFGFPTRVFGGRSSVEVGRSPSRRSSSRKSRPDSGSLRRVSPERRRMNGTVEPTRMIGEARARARLTVYGPARFCQNSVSGWNNIVPQLLRRAVYVLPTLPIYVYFEEKTSNLAWVSNFRFCQDSVLDLKLVPNSAAHYGDFVLGLSVLDAIFTA